MRIDTYLMRVMAPVMRTWDKLLGAPEACTPCRYVGAEGAYTGKKDP